MKVFMSFLVFAMLTGCYQKQYDSKGYVQYVNDPVNGLMVKKDVEEYQYTVLYKPLPYVVLAEERYLPKSVQDLEAKSEEYGGMQYYTLRIKIDGFKDEILKYQIKTPQEYYGRLEYYSFLVKNDIKLLDGRDTLDCMMSHMERSYNLNNYCNLLLGFKNSGKPGIQTKKIFFEDKIFGNGLLQFEIPADKIKNVPTIKRI